jgi:hypothetical protein
MITMEKIFAMKNSRVIFMAQEKDANHASG